MTEGPRIIARLRTKWRLLDYDHELHVFAWVPDKHDPVIVE